MGTINVKNVVTDFGAAGDGATNDTTAIQNALNSAEIDGGGIVFFPKGIYLINNTLKLPNKVQMLGICGTTFGAGSLSIGQALPSSFINQEVSIIKLANGANANMLEQKSGSPYVLYNAGIENLVFWGNKSQQTVSKYGIRLENIASDNDAERGHNRFKYLLIYDIKGTGFYGGTRHHELHIDNVIAYGCDGNGFELYGEDSKLNRVQSAANSGVGIKIKGGALRFFDCDV